MAGVVKVVRTWHQVREAVTTALAQPTEDPFVRPLLVAPCNPLPAAMALPLASSRPRPTVFEPTSKNSSSGLGATRIRGALGRWRYALRASSRLIPQVSRSSPLMSMPASDKAFHVHHGRQPDKPQKP